jgi:hypothetical protein
MKKQIVIFILIVLGLAVFAQDTAEDTKIKPDFDFKFEEFLPFYPGKSFEELKKTYKNPEELKGLGVQKVYRVVVKGLRYRFPVFFQVHTDGTILSFYSRLPSYFLHDTLHQALINRFGKQDGYIKDYGSAVYTWNNEQGMKITYSGSCTITCYPLYINAVINDVPQGLGTFENLLEKLQISKFTGN